jgi:hypothetical protein
VEQIAGGAAEGFPAPKLHNTIWGQLALLQFFLYPNHSSVILVLLSLLLLLLLLLLLMPPPLDLVVMSLVRMVVAAFVHSSCRASKTRTHTL